jgi:FKBP-type peptidyl-prolyl cis-trans isomerase SlyD
MQATRGAVVSFNYTLTNDEGLVIDKSDEGCPLTYLHGYENIIAGLESALEGAEPGDKKDVTVEPAEGYGVSDEEAVFQIEKSSFPEGEEVKVGMTFAGETPNGDIPLRVVDVTDDMVTVDANHPLAGVRLHFAVEIVGVREASEDELAAGYPNQ